MKIKLPISIAILLCFVTHVLSAQTTWPDHKTCAVCLTYDDAINSQLDIAIPQLNKYGLKGTFYMTGSSETINTRLEEWRNAASIGHELGNHTLFHPCNGESKKRDWVTLDQDLDHYTMNRFLDEIKVSNTLLKAVDGKEKRSFAYTCGDMIVEGKDIANFLPDLVEGARTTVPGYQKPDETDVFNLPAFSCNDKTAKEMIEYIEKAQQENSLIILLFHGVGGDYLSVDAAEHEKLLQYLSKNEKEIWVAPVINVVELLK